MRTLSIIGLAFAIFLSGVFAYSMDWFRSVADEVVMRDRWQTRWQAVDISTRSFSAAEGHWSAMAGINSKALDAGLAQLEGVSLTKLGGSLKGVVVTLDKIDITPGTGGMDVAVAISARKENLVLGIALEGEVSVAGIRAAERRVEEKGQVSFTPVTEVSFRVLPIRIAPTLGVPNLERGVRRFWADVAPGLAVALGAGEAMKFTVDLPREISTTIGADEDRTFVVNQSNGSSATAHFKMAPSKIKAAVIYGAPIYTTNAIWFAAHLGTGQAPDLENREPPDGNAAEIEVATRALDAKLQARLPAFMRQLDPAETPQLAIILDTAILRSIADTINGVPSGQRHLDVRLKAFSGVLAEDKWYDNILGEGGISAAFGCPDCAELGVDVSDFHFASQDGRLVATAKIGASGWAGIHGHIDPLIGGGVGTDVRIEGTSGGLQTVSAEIVPTVLADASGYSIAALRWQPSCERIEVVATTDGRIKVDFGWASAPKVGARLNFTAGPSMLQPASVFASAPELVVFPAPAPLAKEGSSADWQLAYPNLASSIAFKPVSFQLIEGQLRMVSDLNVTLHPYIGGTPGARENALAALREANTKEIQVAAQAINAILDMSRTQNRCPIADTGISVILGPIEIGPNNELVKFFRNALHDLTKGPGKNNEFVKAYNAYTDFLGTATDPFDAQAIEAFNQIDGLADTAFGANSDASKAVHASSNAVRFANKAVVDPVGAAEDAKKAADKALEDAAAAAKKAADDAAATAKKAADDAAATAKKAADDAAATAKKAADDAAAAATKAKDDVVHFVTGGLF